MTGREAAALQGLFSKLSRPDRLMLLLHYADDLTAAEIGVVLEVSGDEVAIRLEELRRLARLELAGLGLGPATHEGSAAAVRAGAACPM